MSAPKKPLKPDDFPVNADGTKIKKQDGTTIANTEEPTVAEDVADRLNADEAQREEDKWSA
jgi:accessory colonization factor AcfC